MLKCFKAENYFFKTTFHKISCHISNPIYTVWTGNNSTSYASLVSMGLFRLTYFLFQQCYEDTSRHFSMKYVACVHEMHCHIATESAVLRMSHQQGAKKQNFLDLNQLAYCRWARKPVATECDGQTDLHRPLCSVFRTVG